MADVNVVKQVLSDRSGLYPKNIGNPHIARLLGKGLVLTDAGSATARSSTLPSTWTSSR